MANLRIFTLSQTAFASWIQIDSCHYKKSDRGADAKDNDSYFAGAFIFRSILFFTLDAFICVVPLIFGAVMVLVIEARTCRIAKAAPAILHTRVRSILISFQATERSVVWKDAYRVREGMACVNM